MPDPIRPAGWPNSPPRARVRRPGRHRLRPSFERLEGLLLLTNFVVTNLNDDGSGSLRQAIDSANADPILYPGDTDSISFDLPSSVTDATIDLQSPLPALTRQEVFVSGLGGTVPVGAPGREGNAGIVLDGSGIQGSAFTLAGSEDQISWFYITGCNGPGVSVTGSFDWVTACTIASNSGDGIINTSNGLTAEANLLTANGEFGFQTTGGPFSNLSEGTGSLVTSNWISGNGWGGIETTGTYEDYQSNTIVANGGSGATVDPGATNIILKSNDIGTDSSGAGGLGNAYWGVVVQDAFDVTVGIPGAGNVISGNDQGGVTYRGKSSEAGTIQGNFIGVAPDGTTPLGNGFSGVLIGDWGVTGDAPSSITIGGTAAGAGNVISDNGNFGLWISGADVRGVAVEGNHIGTDFAGNAAHGNAEAGVQIDSGAVNITIGGTTAGSGNVISANGGAGINVIGPGTSFATIEDNIIGTDAWGDPGLGNGLWGVFVDDAPGVVVGRVGAGNDISGNDQGGVTFRGQSSFDETIQSNLIGVAPNGTAPLGNAFSGILIGDWGVSGDAPSSVTIGGTTPGSGNVISANGNFGVWISGAAVRGVVVQGNLIGTNFAGNVAIGNNEAGIQIDSGAVDNLIGGSVSGSGNLVSGGQADGIDLTGAGTSFNLIEGNKIGTDSMGSGAVPNASNGIIISSGATKNTIGGTGQAGNVISANGNSGIWITGAGTTANLVEGNKIGTDRSGSRPLGNAYDGIAIDSGATGNTIGGVSAGDGNVISGNVESGIAILDPGTAGNLVADNSIGLNGGGQRSLPNGYEGVILSDGASNNTIGGLSADARNLISGNGSKTDAGGPAYPGVMLIGAGTSANLVEGNFIGTNATGLAAIGNYGSGVAVEDGADDNTIGGVATGAGNLISGNGNAMVVQPLYGTGSGVNIDSLGAAVVGTLVEGNLIGTDITGTRSLGNMVNGVTIEDGASDNTVGGTTAGAGNIIAFNNGDGVKVGYGTPDAALDNSILDNSIFLNLGSGIAVANSAPQAAPLLMGATSNGTHTTITGTVIGAANTTFLVEFFSSPAGTSQGQTFLGALDVTTCASGTASFSFTSASSVSPGKNITATTTDPVGNTSGFSAPAAVNDVSSDLSVEYGSFVYNRNTRQSSQVLTITNVGAAAITGPIELLLQNLTDAKLVDPSGTYDGNPYVTILASGSLCVGQSLAVTLVFADPSDAPITYTSEFLAGPITTDAATDWLRHPGGHI